MSFFQLSWTFGWSHMNIKAWSNCFVPMKVVNENSAKSALFYQTRSPFTNSATESNFTLITAQSWSPVIVTDCLHEMNVLNEMKFSPLFPVSGVANHHFIWHHFLKSEFSSVLSVDTFILWSWEDQGHAIGSFSTSLYFKCLCIITNLHLLLPCLRKSGSLPLSPSLTPPLALLTQLLSPFAEPSITSTHICLPHSL